MYFAVGRRSYKFSRLGEVEIHGRQHRRLQASYSWIQIHHYHRAHRRNFVSPRLFRQSVSNDSSFSRRKTSVTLESLETYRGLIKDTTDDLEARLQSIDEKLESIFIHTRQGSPSDAADLRLLEEERRSTQKCLEICAQLSKNIDHLQLTARDNEHIAGSDTLPERLTIDGLQECKHQLSLTMAKLEQHMKDTMDRLVARSVEATDCAEERANISTLQEHWVSARQSRDICAKADTYMKENISDIENYATGDAVQFMVSTEGKTIHGRNRGLGWRTRQVGGHLKDVTVQQLSRDLLISTASVVERPSSEDATQAATEAGHEEDRDPRWRERHGPGFTLSSKAPESQK